MTLADRVNPIFLQALRQALRGRTFQVLFWLTLLATMAFSLLYVIHETEGGRQPSGQEYFIWIYGALSFAVHLFVPFSAFLSLGNEWDENTYDLLVLSNLRPREIVGGKLYSALLQAGLWLCAFGPFLTFSFLLPGLDLLAMLLVVGLTVVSSTFLTCVALCLSAAARGRFARTFLMGLLGLALSGAAVAATTIAFAMLENPAEVRSDMGVQVMLGSVSAFVAIGAYCFAFASTRLAHEEENRSSGLRVLSTLILLASLWWAASVYRISGNVLEAALTLGGLGVVAITAFSMLYAAEDRRLGRRVRLEVPRNPALALLATPWLPGGSRGILLHLVHLGLWLGGLAGVLSIWPPGRTFLPFETPWPAWWIAVAYTWLYLALPMLVFRPWLGSLLWRVTARVAVPAVAFLLFLVPTLLLFVFTEGGNQVLEHLGNPFYVIEVLFAKDSWLAGAADGDTRGLVMLWIVTGLGIVLLLLHLPGVIAGLREVLRASRERRA